MFSDLHPSVRWHEGGRLDLAIAYEAPVALDDRGLLLVPSVFAWPGIHVVSDPPWQPTFIYTARGTATAWELAREPAPDALRRLIGPTRAAILHALQTPQTGAAASPEPQAGSRISFPCVRAKANLSPARATTSRIDAGPVSPPVGRVKLVLIPVGLGLLAAIVTWWTWRAIHDPAGFDFRLAYRGGQVAWANGHPEQQSTWTGTPLLAVAVALLSRAASLRTATILITVLNVILVLGAAGVVMARLRRYLSAGWWWAIAFALLSFGPMMSTVWWKQFNIIALGGWCRTGRCERWWGWDSRVVARVCAGCGAVRGRRATGDGGAALGLLPGCPPPVPGRSAGAERPSGWLSVESEHGEPGEVHGGSEQREVGGDLRVPRTRARRPPCLRRIRWLILRSTVGRVCL